MLVDTKTLITIVTLVVGLFAALLGALWWMLNWKIDKGDQHNSEKIDKVEANLKTEDRRIADNVHELRGQMSPWAVNIEKALERIKQKLGIR